jgi:hypothetical protein
MRPSAAWRRSAFPPLVSVGGDGSLTIAQQMHEAGIPIVGVPKTIDNDLAATTVTFGFDSAVACATDALDRLHTTAESHNRVMVLEVMGRYAGWIAIYAGMAGGADVILIPGNSLSLRVHLRGNDGREKRANILRWSSRPRARNRRAAILSPRAASSKIARRASAASARWWRRKSKSAPARKPAPWCWATCNAAAAPPSWTASFAPCSAPKPSN